MKQQRYETTSKASDRLFALHHLPEGGDHLHDLSVATAPILCGVDQAVKPISLLAGQDALELKELRRTGEQRHKGLNSRP